MQPEEETSQPQRACAVVSMVRSQTSAWDEKRRFAWKGAVFDLALGVLINSRLG